MSKMDNLRAMREAKYAAAQKRAGTTAGAAARTTARRAAPVAPPVAAPVEPAALESFGSDSAAADDALCGHRNMSGRSCTREKGHAAKSHRYS